MITSLILKHPAVREIQAALERSYSARGELMNEHRDALDELRELRKYAPRAARFQLAGGMSEEQIERALRGTNGSPIVKAIEAHVSAKIVAASDIATDAPREMIASAERVIPPYTSEMRLHDAGRASAFAEILADLQERTAAAEVEETPAA